MLFIILVLPGIKSTALGRVGWAGHRNRLRDRRPCVRRQLQAVQRLRPLREADRSQLQQRDDMLVEWTELIISLL